MKLTTKRLVSLAAIALTGVTLVACGKSGQAGKGKSANDFEVATVRWSDWGEKYHKGFIDDTAKKDGINLKWDTYLNADWGDKKSTVISGGKLPDAFVGSNAFTDGEIEKNKAMFIPLEKYIDKDMPNLKKALSADPTLKAMITDADGHIYSLPKKLPMRPTVGNQLFINKKWLDKLGLQVPTTYDEFVTVLKAFKDKDPNGDGKADEIPFGAGNIDSVYGYILPFGVTQGADAAYQMGMQNNTPVFWPITDNYKQGIEAMSTAYKAGLIDSEIFTQDDTMAQSKRQGKTELVGVAGGWTADATFTNFASDYVALPALKGPDGNQYVMSDPDHYNMGRNEVLLTTQCQNPEKLLKFFDKFYTDDASIQNFYGSFGVGTQKSGDGYQVLKPQNGKSADEWAWINSLRDFGPKYVSADINNKVQIDDTTGDGLKLKLDSEMKQYARPAFPNVMYTESEINELSSLYTDISTYVKQQTAQWVTKGGVDKNWASYKDKLNKMGLSKFEKIQNDAYARYMKSLNK